MSRTQSLRKGPVLVARSAIYMFFFNIKLFFPLGAHLKLNFPEKFFLEPSMATLALSSADVLPQ